MKRLLFLFLCTTTAFAQEKEYLVTYKDQGAVIHHSTCRLVVHQEYGEVLETGGIERFGLDYLNEDFVELLSLKGYNVINATGDYNKINLQEEVKVNDLSLAMDFDFKVDKSTFSSNLGLLNSPKSLVEQRKFTSRPITEFKVFKSQFFKYNFKPGKPFKLLKNKKGRNAMLGLYESLPDCYANDSGHSYEEEKYNTDIVLGELNTCLSLYNQDLRRLIKYKSSKLRSYTGYGAAISLVYALAYPAVWPVAGAIGGYHAIKGYTTLALENNLNDSLNFLKEVKKCHLDTLSGRVCTNSSLERTFGKLGHAEEKRIRKYLEHMSFPELVQKITDYLGANRSCSVKAKNVRKITMKKILKKVERTF